MKEAVFVSDFGPRKTGLVVANLDIMSSISGYSWSPISSTGMLNILLMPFRLLIKRFKSKYAYITISDNRIGLLKDVVVLVSAWLLGFRVVAHSHSGRIHLFMREFLIRNFYSNTLDKLIVLSDSFRIDLPQCIVIENVARPEFYNRERKEKDYAKSGYNVCFLGNLMKAKGVEDIVQLIDEDRLSGENICFHFFGGFREQYIKNILLELQKKRPDIEICYFDSPEELVNRLLTMDVMILPTWYPTEAYPLSIIESLLCGVKVVSTNHAAIPEILNDSIFGRVIDLPVKQDQLIGGLKKCFDELRLDKTLPFKIQAAASKRWAREVYLSKMTGVFQEIW